MIVCCLQKIAILVAFVAVQATAATEKNETKSEENKSTVEPAKLDSKLRSALLKVNIYLSSHSLLIV